MPEWSSSPAYAAILTRLEMLMVDRSACSDHLAGRDPGPRQIRVEDRGLVIRGTTGGTTGDDETRLGPDLDCFGRLNRLDLGA